MPKEYIGPIPVIRDNWQNAAERALVTKEAVTYRQNGKIYIATYADVLFCIGYDAAKKRGLLADYERIILKVSV